MAACRHLVGHLVESLNRLNVLQQFFSEGEVLRLTQVVRQNPQHVRCAPDVRSHTQNLRNTNAVDVDVQGALIPKYLSDFLSAQRGTDFRGGFDELVAFNAGGFTAAICGKSRVILPEDAGLERAVQAEVNDLFTLPLSGAGRALHRHRIGGE